MSKQDEIRNMLTTLRHEAELAGRLDVVVEVDSMIEKWSANEPSVDEVEHEVTKLEDLIKTGSYHSKTRVALARSEHDVGATEFLAPPKPRDPSKCDYWGLKAAREILAARSQYLPENYEERFQSLAEKATMTVAGTGTGAELVDVIKSNVLLRDFYLATRVMSAIPAFAMETGKMTMSEIGDAVFYKPQEI